MTDITALDIDTPALLIDLEVVEANLAAMQARADAAGAALRPHVKAHKIPELARAQVRKGAVGITASKVSEAHIMVEAGIGDVFIANQVVTAAKLQRLIALGRKAKVSVGLDSPAGAKILSEACSAANREMDCLIEVDSGLNRCGVAPGRPAVALHQAVKDLPGLRVRGIFTHAGQVYGKAGLEEVRAVSRLESRLMVETAALLAAAGGPPDIVSVGSTPTMRVWEGCAGVTEIRPGNYIFLDAIQIALGVARPEQCALTVMSTVISRPQADRAVIDAGAKVLALDKGGHGTELTGGFGLVLGTAATIERLSEEHGIMAVEPHEKLAVGDRVRIIPNHTCPVMNLADLAYGIRQGRVETEFTITARGKVH
jgi:D-serine deaminase-like pyridoxal phosphate-dependent protein